MKIRPEKFILVIGSGSIAAANLAGLVFELKEKFKRQVVVILSASAKKFVTLDTLIHLGKADLVLLDDSPSVTDLPNHIWASENAAAVLVYPASAGFIGKMANGMALDLASTTILCCCELPILIVPSMNKKMWDNPFVQKNIDALGSAEMKIAATDHGLAPPVNIIQEQFKQLL